MVKANLEGTVIYNANSTFIKSFRGTMDLLALILCFALCDMIIS